MVNEEVERVLRRDFIIRTQMKKFENCNEYKDDDDPSELRFFRRCPYFQKNGCNSSNWGLKSPCYKCFKEKKYNPENAKTNSSVDLFLTIKDEKCR